MLLCSSEWESLSTGSAFRGMRDSKLGAHRWGRVGQARACPLATSIESRVRETRTVTELLPQQTFRSRSRRLYGPSKPLLTATGVSCGPMTRATSAPDTADALLARYRAMAEEASDIIVLHEDGRIVCATGAL
jgi:hypothetical protein